jgi:cytidylate kinase
MSSTPLTSQHRPGPVEKPSPASTRGLAPRQAWFASDFHLHGGDPDGLRRACRFVGHVREQGADALFLLGDVFRAWLGPPSLADPGLEPFLRSLREAVDDGLRVVLLHGNHDFLMGPELERALGVEVYAGSLDIDLAGERVRLVHGDGFCTLDRSYHRLHGVLRGRPMRWLLGRLPPATLTGLANRLIHEASRSCGGKPRAMMDIVDDEVLAVLQDGVDVVLCGHVHRARDAGLPADRPDGRLLVMADFESTGSHAVFRDGRLELSPVDPRFARPPALVVAVDGPAGSGKSSVCRALARLTGFMLLDSGALYRAVTLRALAAGLEPDDPRLGALARELDLSVDGRGRVLLDGVVVQDASLRGGPVSAAVSQVSAVPEVRAALMDVQRRVRQGCSGLVAEGRDMASVVFPDAEVQVYLDASPAVRAARRMAQNPGEGRTLDEVVAALRSRDERDSSRATAPLARSAAARVLDTSEMDEQAVVEQLVAWVEQARAGSGTGKEGVAPVQAFS